MSEQEPLEDRDGEDSIDVYLHDLRELEPEPNTRSEDVRTWAAIVAALAAAGRLIWDVFFKGGG